MANRRGETKGTTKRKSVSRSATTKNTRIVARETVSDQQAAVQGQAKADVEQRVYAKCKRRSFQLRAQRERVRQDGYREVVPAKYLKFGNRPIIALDEEELEIVEQILDGKWTDGQVNSRDWSRIARASGLELIYPGLVARPLETWDDLPDGQVVPVATAAGVLRDVEAVERAIAYEEQSPKRKPARESREAVVDQLEELAKALTSGGVTVADPVQVAAAQVAAPVDGGGLLVPVKAEL